MTKYVQSLILNLCKHERPSFPHAQRVMLHYRQISSNRWCKISLIYYLGSE
jgi:hypothetical protein